MDLVFCFDTTGSMSSAIDQVRQNVATTLERLLSRSNGKLRISVVACGDYCDAARGFYATEHTKFSEDAAYLTKFVREVSSTGGGDMPGCYELALQVANKLKWRPEARKAFVMFGSTPTHPPLLFFP